MDDRLFVEAIHGRHDALFEFLLGGNADVAQHRAGELGEEALDQVEPGAVRGRESEREPAGRTSGEPGVGLFGDVGGMIVEDQVDRRMSRIGGVEKLEELDELAAAMTVPDQSVNLASDEIDASQQA